MLDIQIRNGIIYDGTGGAPYRGCVDILGDRIVSVGQGDREAGIVIDAAGKCVCPGFVDAHSHCDLAAVRDLLCGWKLRVFSVSTDQTDKQVGPALQRRDIGQQFLGL